MDYETMDRAGLLARIAELEALTSDRAGIARILGSAKSERKTLASRENGKKGGRPRVKPISDRAGKREFTKDENVLIVELN